MNQAADVIVIGAGIHGAGVAQAAAAAGYTVILLEQFSGPAQGTSGRSSKLIHGGLRYLEQGHIGLVRECLTERSLLLRLAPDLVHLTPFHLPVYDSGDSALKLRAGLCLYALLTGFRAGGRFRSVPRSRWHALDGLETGRLRHLYRYYDAQTDDVALTRAVLASAVGLGANIAYQTTVVNVELGRRGVVVRCTDPSGERELTAKALVNAAGPWVAEVLSRVVPAQTVPRLSLVGGTHILLPGRLQQGAYTLRARDGRVFFALPAGPNILVGTTELEYRGDPGAIAPTPMETAYLLENFRCSFPGHPAAAQAPVDAFAGLRVLAGSDGSAHRRSRETLLLPADGGDARLLSIIGGKLTAYRATAEKALRRLAGILPPASPRADTRMLPLVPVD